MGNSKEMTTEKKEHWVKTRLRRLAQKGLSLAFLTWLMIFIAYILTKQALDAAFLGFTAGLIGIKVIGDKKETGGEK